MAIRIEGLPTGPVTVDNAAQEDTLRQLLSVMQTRQAQQKSSNAQAAAASLQSANAASAASQSLSTMAVNSNRAASATSGFLSSVEDKITNVGRIAEEMTHSQLGTYLKQLGLTAVDVAVAWSKNFKDIRLDPITNSAKIFNTAIDATVDGLTLLSKGAGNLVRDIPVLGQLVGAITNDAIPAALRIVGGAFQTANNTLAKEVSDTVNGMQTFNKMGGNFAGSFMELRTFAHQAGLNVDQFSSAIKNAEPSIREMGMNIEQSSGKVAMVQGELNKTVGASGKTLREELLKLGYSVEEQTGLSADYMARLRSTMSAQDLYRKSSQEIAMGTRQYAADLKILADITGQDAKKLQERARQESQRGVLLGRLSNEQRESFQDTAAALSVFPDQIRGNIQNALVQQLSTGAITDPIVAQSEEITEFVRRLSEQIQAGSKTMVADTGVQAAELQNTLKSAAAAGGTLFEILDQANAHNVGGLAGQLATAYNALLATNLSPEAIRQTQENAKKQAEATDRFNDGIVKAYTSAQDFSVAIGRLTTEALPAYSNAIGVTTKALTGILTSSMQLMAGERLNQNVPTRYTTEDYKRDMKENFKEVIRGLVPARAKGGVSQGPTSGYLNMLHGNEAVIPLSEGRTVPVKLSGTQENDSVSSAQLQEEFKSLNLELSNIKDKSAVSSKQLQEGFINALTIFQRTQQLAQLPKDDNKETIKELPTMLSTALESVFSGPNGFAQTLESVKNQLAADNKDQLNVLQQQVDRMNDMIRTMQDHTRVSENIANVLA